MKKLGIYLLLGIMICALCIPLASASDTGIIADQQLITITQTNQGLLVNENIKITNNGQENATIFRFWIQQDASNVVVTAGPTGKSLTPVVSGNIQTCNLTTANLTIEPSKSLTVQVTYTLPSAAETFEQTLLYDTTLFTVTYAGQTLFQGENLLSSAESTNSLQVRLFKPTEAPLSLTVLIIIFVIVVAALGILLLLLRRQRSKKKKTGLVESEETLSTKKTLLLSLLKDLEKQYRAKSISDETYNKLKDEYKQQAVETMRRLEDTQK
jgi:hypothetical protein